MGMTQTQAPRQRPRGGRRATPRRRSWLRLPVLLVALALVAGGLAWALLVRDDTGSTAGKPAAAPHPITSLTAQLLPPIAQAGARPASADKASPLVKVTAKTTGKGGGDVTLQVRRDKTWVDVDTTPLDSAARARSRAPLRPPVSRRRCGSSSGNDRAMPSRPGSRTTTGRSRSRTSSPALAGPDQVELPAARPAQPRLRAHQVGELRRRGLRRERLAAARDDREPGQAGLLPQRPHRHREPVHVHLRRLGGPDQVPEAARHARRVLDAGPDLRERAR